jgi:predicted methyltransferase
MFRDAKVWTRQWGAAMKTLVLFFISVLLSAGVLPALAADDAVISAAIDSLDRPDKDREADVNRKPKDIMVFSGIKPGDVVVDIDPGAGYYSRILSRIVGAQGHVYELNPTWVIEKFPKSRLGMDGLIATGKYSNLEHSIQEIETPKFSKPVDVVFFSLGYHDQHWVNRDVAKMNKALFDALRPGGVYLVIDHSAQAGSGKRDVGTLHRIDAALVKSEILATGFVFESESNVLRNPADPLTESVFGTIRGKTDQFVYKFVKPVT